MSLNIIDRRQHALGGQANHRALSQITHIAWHYTGVARENRSFITNHERWWRNGLGWTRGGYHYYIDADANIYWNYNHTTRSNGVGNNNTYLINICVEANSRTNYTKEQEDARQKLTLHLMEILKIPASNVKGHKEFPGQSTACPGYTTSELNSFRSALAKGKVQKAKTQKVTATEKVTPKATGQRVHLPSSAKSWRVYRNGGPYTTGNEIGSLAPSKFGGLSYDIVGSPVKDVVLINTRDFGTVAIYVAKSTGATISGSGAGSAKPQVPKSTGQKLHLPSSAKTWRIYNPNGPYTTSHSIHQLTPAEYGGLTYEIKGSPAPDVYLIDTGVKGRVAIYAGAGTGATISGTEAPRPAAATPKKEQPKKQTTQPSNKRSLHLPASVDTWRVYKPNGPYVANGSGEVGKLAPKRYGGLTYDIIGSPAKDVYLINTSSFGQVAIYAGSDTSARITGGSAPAAAPKKAAPRRKKLHLPKSAKTWRVYNVNGPYTTGNEIHLLTPSAFKNGITYDILEEKGNHIYIINTGVKGRVAIYAGPGTGATIS